MTVESMTERLFDSHAHLEWLPQQPRVAALGVGTSPSGWEKQKALGGPMAYGLHPWFLVPQKMHKDLEKLPEYLTEAVAVGEIGLDRGQRCPAQTYPLQEVALLKQLKIAIEFDLPVVLHEVKSTHWMLELLQPENRGVVHAFSGSLETMREYLRRGFYFGFGDLRGRRARAAVAAVPADRYLLESDAPNVLASPDNLLEVADQVARLRRCEVEEVVEQSRANAARLFGLDL